MTHIPVQDISKRSDLAMSQMEDACRMDDGQTMYSLQPMGRTVAAAIGAAAAAVSHGLN